MDKGTFLLSGIGFGVVLGSLVGVAVNNIAICVSMGMGLGALLGAILSTFKKDDDDEGSL